MRRVDRAARRAGDRAGERRVDLVLEPARHEARVGDTALDLTPTEFRLLEALVRATATSSRTISSPAPAGRPRRDPDLLWLKPHLARLRAKVEGAGGPQILAVRGVGYRIDGGVAACSAPYGEGERGRPIAGDVVRGVDAVRRGSRGRRARRAG